ncbi:hypothetical protein SO802_013122 [Lithocarpus litseifolius]|uniref:RNase H type-1 domain-containing protein n=1 Tax=Lithocarpus litseifolius TaxID=425828 RepID=A0AAW2D5H2_9ROSI
MDVRGAVGHIIKGIRQMLVSELIVEGDNVTVMQTISSTHPNLSRLGLVYKYICCLAAGHRYVSFSCVRHSANSVAHSLARYASLLDDEVVWMEESPPPALDTTTNLVIFDG